MKAAVWQLGQDGLRYGLYFPLAGLFPLPTAYRLAQTWGRLEARQAPPGLLDAIRSNAAEALRPQELPAVDMGEKFFEVMSCDRVDAYASVYASRLHSWRRLRRWVRVSGEERLLAAVAEGRGVLLLTFHLAAARSSFRICGVWAWGRICWPTRCRRCARPRAGSSMRLPGGVLPISPA